MKVNKVIGGLAWLGVVGFMSYFNAHHPGTGNIFYTGFFSCLGLYVATEIYNH